MPAEITMPQLSDTMTEGTVVKWNKKEGDKIRAGEEIADVETDKATMPMEVFEGGTLAVILVKEGDKVPVGGLLGVIATGSEKPDQIKQQYASKAGTAAKSSAAAASSSSQSQAKAPMQKAEANSTARSSSSVATLVAASNSEIHEPDEVGHGATREPATPIPPIRGSGSGDGDSSGNGHGRIRVSPLAKRIAADKKIDLAQVRGTGPEGRVIQRDVLNYQPPAKPTGSAAGAGDKKKSGPPPISLAPKIASGQSETIPLTKMRTVIAQRLQQSKQNLPHFYETVDIDVEDLSRLRAQMNRALEAEGVRLSLGDLVAKGISHALLINPALNAHFNGAEITRHGDVHLGMAVALPEGLIVPVLRGVNKLSLKDIRTKSADLVERARKQNLKRDELSGATFTVSNLGTYGIREFSAIINPPEVGILAIGAAEPRPVVREGQIVPRTMMTVTLSADHRAVDGATAAEFLKTLKMLLEEPGMMLV